MKYVLLSCFLALLALSAVAYVITPAPDPTGRQTIHWASDDNPRRRAQIATFNSIHPGYDLRLTAVDGKDIDKVITQSLSGVGPDVFDAYRERFAMLHEAGLLQDVTDALASRGITLDSFWPAARPMISSGGRIYGVPFNIGSDALWYHRDVFQAQGLPVPPDADWPWDDFVATAKRLTTRDPRTNRVTRYGVMGIIFLDVLLTTGGRVFTPDGRRCLLDSPEAIEACTRWTDLMLTHKVMPSPADEAAMSTQGGWNSGALTLFKEKRVAMAAGGRWWLCLLRDFKDAAGQFPLTLGVAEKPVVRDRRFVAFGRISYVNALSPHAGRAADFLAYLCSDTHADQINSAGDALPGRPAATTRPSYYHDPTSGRDAGPSEVWKSALLHAVPEELSPYVPARVVTDTIKRQNDLVLARAKTPQQAMRDAAAELNDTIQRTIARDPALRHQYDASDNSPVYGNHPLDETPAHPRHSERSEESQPPDRQPALARAGESDRPRSAPSSNPQSAIPNPQ
jgi:multiple sugar transport system substrate-binding protein